MPKSAFVLPAGVRISTDGGRLSIRHEGDVHLEQTLGMPLGTVDVGGDLTVALDRASGELRAGGRLRLLGSFDGDSLHGDVVEIGRAVVRARSVSADRRIVLGAARLAVDVVIAPEIRIDPAASGRVTVIESQNERGPTKIKGGFTLAEYDEVVGDADRFLAVRGLAPFPDDEDPDDDATARPAGAPEHGDPVPDHDDPVHPQLADAVGRILSCYAGAERPPPVDRLRELVSTRDYDTLRSDIGQVWNGLLTFHQERGIRPNHQVTHAFNVIHGLVQGG